MSKFHRGKNLVRLCSSEKDSKQKISPLEKDLQLAPCVDITLKKDRRKDLLPSTSNSMKLPCPNYESSIWTRPYSMTMPVFNKFNEFETSDASSIDIAISKLNTEILINNNELEQELLRKNLYCDEELESSSDDFDSDDSVKDKDYVPEEGVSKYSSGSEESDADSIIYNLPSTVRLPDSSEECHTELDEGQISSSFEPNADCQNDLLEFKKVIPLKLLCQNALNKYLQQNTEDCGGLETDRIEKSGEEELVVVIIVQEEEIEKNTEKEEENNQYVEEVDKVAEMEDNKEEEPQICIEVNERGSVADEAGTEGDEENTGKDNLKLYTKSGNIRKRKMYDSSLSERQCAKKNNYRQNFLVTEGCNSTCIKKCMQKFNAEERENINKCYWDMSWTERRIYIQQSSYVSVPKRKLTAEPKRLPKRTYFFKNAEQNQIDVCKTFYLTTLGYKSNNDKVLYNSLDGNLLDNRGKYERSTLIERNIITQHIESFNPTNSHYRREHAPLRRYLPSDLNVTMMHEDFSEKHLDVKISYDLYRKHLKSLNISFAQLGNEECEICEAHNIHCKSESHDKENLPADCQVCYDYLAHKQRSLKARALYTEHKEKKDLDHSHIYFSTDLEKVIMLPRMNTFKEVIFCPRLVAYNQTFAPLGKRNLENPLAILWHEATAGRKQQDIISAFQAFLMHYRDYEFIDLWLDNCSAQNKNWLLYFFLVDIVNSDEIGASYITLNYFEKGHTYMSCDHFHHQVELSMKKKSKLYDFQDFVDVVGKANSGRATVKEMKISDFLDFNDFTSNRRIQSSSPRVYMKNIVQAMFKRGSHNLFYKTDFDNEFIEMCFIKDSYLKPKNGPVSVKKARETEKGIQVSRKMSILSKLDKLIPPHKLRFWQNIQTYETD